MVHALSGTARHGSSLGMRGRFESVGNPQDTEYKIVAEREAAVVARTTPQPAGPETPGDRAACELCQQHGTRRVSGSRGVAPDLFVTMCEVRIHDSKEDCWIIAKGRVFDVTNYIEDHPGGQRSLVRRAGGAQDCEEDLNFHSRHGRSVWERLCIGQIIPCETPPGELHGAGGEVCVIL
ncbi:Cytochrome b5 [Hondaea fermentalgiana]|uniref:Cytochrome b5 n=1 Tax=Hondaea fermentalgiana TaxID=2315210 RepID=A0A2R5G273_9STRA|nr:Cytochrome b5 [Hondaea fermentalgiana]|eukprot:GBG23828.1 Cytochrome b5 [Hondaea fermentalgiana]